MALSDYGRSFSPTQKAGEEKGARPGGTPTQEAIRTISTRIPRIAQGGRAIAPQPLLNAPGGAGMAAPMGTMGQPNVGGLEELIRRLFGLLGGMPAQAGPVGAPAPQGGFGAGQLSTPAPRVTPGLQPLPPGAPFPSPPPQRGPIAEVPEPAPPAPPGPSFPTNLPDPSAIAARAMWGF